VTVGEFCRAKCHLIGSSNRPDGRPREQEATHPNSPRFSTTIDDAQSVLEKGEAVSTIPRSGSGEHPSGEHPYDQHASQDQLYEIIRWVTSDSHRTYRLALLLIITLGAVVAIAAFLSTAFALWLSAMTVSGALGRWIAKHSS